MKRVRAIVVFLALGAVVNVAVEWGSVLKVIYETKVVLRERINPTPGCSFVTEHQSAPRSEPDPVASWGWPLTSLTSPSIVDGLHVTHLPAGVSFGGDAWLPIEPRWFGFMANSAMYGAALSGFMLVPAVIQRGWRRRRGLCTTCAYDLRGAEHERCPECGNQVAETRRAVV